MNKNERAIFDRLKVAYPPGEWALLPQVPDGTGANKVRTADAIAMQLWPSRGLTLHGFEFKISRGDWRNELKNPEKAESIAAYCHFWWVVAPKGVVPVEELPHAWGLIEISDKGQLRRPKQAPLQEQVKPVSYSFLAGLLRAVQAWEVPDAHLQERYQLGRKEGIEEGKKSAENRMSYERERHQRLAENVRMFEEKAGVNLDTFNPPEDMARAVKIVLAGQVGRIEQRLENLADQAERVASDIRERLSKEAAV